MTNPSVPHRLLRLLLAVAFLAATGTEAYGLWRCPIHDAVTGTGGGHRTASPAGTDVPASAAVSNRSPPASPDSGVTAPAHGHDDRADATCTCVGDCCQGESSSRTALHLPVRFEDPALHRTTALSAATAKLPRGPTHSLFELHLPNAPPFVLS